MGPLSSAPPTRQRPHPPHLPSSPPPCHCLQSPRQSQGGRPANASPHTSSPPQGRSPRRLTEREDHHRRDLPLRQLHQPPDLPSPSSGDFFHLHFPESTFCKSISLNTCSREASCSLSVAVHR